MAKRFAILFIHSTDGASHIVETECRPSPIHRSPSYPESLFTVDSQAVIVIALVWFTERAFDHRKVPMQ